MSEQRKARYFLWVDEPLNRREVAKGEYEAAEPFYAKGGRGWAHQDAGGHAYGGKIEREGPEA